MNAHRCKRILDLMGHTGCHGGHGGKVLASPEPCFIGVVLGDIADHDHIGGSPLPGLVLIGENRHGNSLYALPFLEGELIVLFQLLVVHTQIDVVENVLIEQDPGESQPLIGVQNGHGNQLSAVGVCVLDGKLLIGENHPVTNRLQDVLQHLYIAGKPAQDIYDLFPIKLVDLGDRPLDKFLHRSSIKR
ncbi:hypothetical protein SDC9_93262 [bioreactor metagenome]|uniref:Uncharacterized protein n=1 Tax=bioreactor metagenome TaxID=1076179 RepID=A0A645A1D9_9ZZZZ